MRKTYGDRVQENKKVVVHYRKGSSLSTSAVAQFCKQCPQYYRDRLLGLYRKDIEKLF